MVASSAVANLCLIPETGRERQKQEEKRRRVQVKALGKWGNGKHMQLKVSGVRRQKQEKDSEKRG